MLADKHLNAIYANTHTHKDLAHIRPVLYFGTKGCYLLLYQNTASFASCSISQPGYQYWWNQDTVFSSPQGSLMLPFHSLPLCQLHLSLVFGITQSPLYVHNFVFLRMLYKRNHAVWKFGGLSFHTRHNSLESHIDCCVYQPSRPFHCWVIFHGIDVSLSV